MSLDQLEKIRRFELVRILAVLKQNMPQGGRVLELGAGTGWQAQAIVEAGYDVEAIDMPTSTYVDDRVFPVRDYDGYTIPFPDNSFDAVFSSNVLEHVAHADAFQAEIRRVLKPEGFALHVVPSGSWRLWSNIAHYPYILKAILRRLSGQAGVVEGVTCGTKELVSATPRSVLRRIFVPNRDGEIGNAFTEIYHFSRWSWNRLFCRNGWLLESRNTNGLFYTAYSVLGESLPIAVRAHLSRILGGSCHIYVLRLKDASGSH